MGKQVVSSPYVVLSASEFSGKAMVDNNEAKGKAVPRAAGRQFSPGFWTETLGKLGLESPGYHETVELMKANGKLKTKT